MFENKKMINKAKSWIKFCKTDEFMKSSISKSLKGTQVLLGLDYSSTVSTQKCLVDGKYLCGTTVTSLLPKTVEEAILHCDKTGKKAVVLNFASFLHPGGGFTNGMIAQEEALCHVSGLYPILEAQKNYYNYNSKHKNSGLYDHCMIVSKDVPFFYKDRKMNHHVITCAATNCSSCLRYKHGDGIEEYQKQLKERAEMVYLQAALTGADTIILGAWGCGVFRHDPAFVAKMWLEITKKYDGLFEHVIHPVPNEMFGQSAENYRAFEYIYNSGN